LAMSRLAALVGFSEIHCRIPVLEGMRVIRSP
jgi:hypothetical protein